MNLNLSKDDYKEIKQLIEKKIVDLRGRDSFSNMRKDFSKGALSSLDIKRQLDEQIDYYELLKVKINFLLK